ncbi:hypothetical protein ACHWQZ_G010538 [Mnemiopsis leidyi]
MGCGSSAFSSSAQAQSATLHTKDAGSQTNVTVLVSSHSSDARTEARDARKELIMQHRYQALAKAQELSNNKSGYNTATYTGSGMSTPRSAYSRTKKFRGSLGSLSDCDLKSRSEVLTVDMNNSRSNLSDRSSNARKTQVSFRNEEYNKMASANVKRRKSYIGMKKKSTSILRKGHKVSAAGSEHSESSGTVNSTNKQADTGYDGSVSSGPSQATLVYEARKSVAASDCSISSNISTKPNADFPIISHTMSNETNPGRLSVVASMDEQSFIHENTCDGQTIADSLKNNDGSFTNSLSDTVTDLLNSKATDLDSANPNVNNLVISNNDDLHQYCSEKTSDSLSKKGPLPDLPTPLENGSVIDAQELTERGVNSENNLINVENVDLMSSQQTPNNHLPNDPLPDLPMCSENGIVVTDAEVAKSNVIVVAKSHVIAKSDSVSSMNQLVNITSSSEVNNGITAVE